MANRVYRVEGQMINQRVLEVAEELVATRDLRDPQELSQVLAQELLHLDVLGVDEFAERVDLKQVVADLVRAHDEFSRLECEVYAENTGLFINRGRLEALIFNLLTSSLAAGARLVQVCCRESPEGWSFSVRDDGGMRSLEQRRERLNLAYQLRGGGRLQVGELALFIAQRIAQFYDSALVLRSFGDGGGEATLQIMK